MICTTSLMDLVQFRHFRQTSETPEHTDRLVLFGLLLPLKEADRSAVNSDAKAAFTFSGRILNSCSARPFSHSSSCNNNFS